MEHIVDRLLGELEPGDDLPLGIHGNRCLDEPFPRLAGPPGIVGTGIGTRKSARIDSGDRDHFSPTIDEEKNPFQVKIEKNRPNPSHELLEGGEMRDLLEIQVFPNRCHQLDEFTRVSIILS